MQGRDDKMRFVQAFNRLGLALKCNFKDEKERAATQQVYFDSLEDLSIEAVEAGEKTLRVEGTTDNWFPTSPEWFDAAGEFEVKRLERPVAGLLMPSPELLEQELAATRDARDLFVTECREKGREGLAQFFELLPVRHPSEDPEAPICVLCADTGMMTQGDGAGPCGCIAENPRIRAQAIRHQRLSRFKRRHQRTAALQPARSNKEFSLAADL